MSVNYVYKTGQPLPQHEAVIHSMWKVLVTLLELPDTLCVVFDDLGPQVYADTKVSERFKGQVTINTALWLRDIPPIFVHEVIHVHQIHTGLLTCDEWGNTLWRGRIYRPKQPMTWTEYCKLPWEADVLARHKQLLDHALTAALENLEK